ncbi:hypothetical protein [Pseudomonas nitroreducens]|uniref:hypothetical protein n=1 Tax=Pseudomonas nitroreducens TaxID=46680 RepID=UPI00187561E1|nr:hypothetical protein [Pseudomonas nitritireducens]
MALYFLEYDLRKQRNYEKLYAELQRLGAVRILKSLWCFKYQTASSVALRDHFRNFIDSDDGLIVAEVSDWASIKTDGHPNSLK